MSRSMNTHHAPPSASSGLEEEISRLRTALSAAHAAIHPLVAVPAAHATGADVEQEDDADGLHALEEVEHAIATARRSGGTVEVDPGDVDLYVAHRAEARAELGRLRVLVAAMAAGLPEAVR